MKIVTKTIFAFITFAMLAQPSKTVAMHRIGAAVLGAAATTGIAYYVNNAVQTAKRTYVVGERQITAPETAQVPFYRNENNTQYKHKFMWFLDLTGIKFSHADVADQCKGNSLILVDELFGQGIQKPGVSITVYSNHEIDWKSGPNLLFKKLKDSNKLVIEPKNPNQYGRIDCIFSITPANIE